MLLAVSPTTPSAAPRAATPVEASLAKVAAAMAAVAVAAVNVRCSPLCAPTVAMTPRCRSARAVTVRSTAAIVSTACGTKRGVVPLFAGVLNWTLHKSEINYKNRVSWPDPTSHERSRHAHPARCHFTRTPSLRHAVSQPDLAESPNPAGRRDTGPGPTHRGCGATRHGTQRRPQLRSLPPGAQSGGVVAPPGGWHPARAAAPASGPGRWSVEEVGIDETLERRRGPKIKPWASTAMRCAPAGLRWSRPAACAGSP